MRWFLGAVLTFGTPLGVLVHSSSDWHQNWPLDMLCGYLVIAAIISMILALEEA